MMRSGRTGDFGTHTTRSETQTDTEASRKLKAVRQQARDWRTWSRLRRREFEEPTLARGPRYPPMGVSYDDNSWGDETPAPRRPENLMTSTTMCVWGNQPFRLLPSHFLTHIYDSEELIRSGRLYPFFKLFDYVQKWRCLVKEIANVSSWKR